MTKTVHPGWQQFTEHLTEAIKKLSLVYAGTADDAASASLQAYVDRIAPELTDAVGADLAARIIEVFALAVMSRKYEIEAGGGASSAASGSHPSRGV